MRFFSKPLPPISSRLLLGNVLRNGTPFSFTVLIKVRRKYGHPTLNYSFIILLTALEMAHGETPRWRAGSANRLECTKKRISLQNTRLPLHLRALARNALSHCVHVTKLHNIRKSIPNWLVMVNRKQPCRGWLMDR